MTKFAFYLFLFIHMDLYSVDFVLFTQPKTATHLLIPILEELTQKKCYWAPEYKKQSIPMPDPFKENFELALQNPQNYLFNLGYLPWTKKVMDQVWKNNQTKKTFLHLHAPYSGSMESYLVRRQCINFFVKRDPRDQIISLLNHYKNINFNDKEIELLETDDERLLTMIKKESRRQTIHYMNWLDSPVCCVLNFEKLMGTHGGKATHQEAINEIRKIANALELDLSDSELERVYQKSFGHGWSFFKGKPDVWKEYFNEEHKIAIKEEIGDLLIKFEYEKDLNW